MMEDSIEQRLLLSFYGDDFTGSTDAMEALAWNGIRTVLFLEPPTAELLASRFPDIGAFGVAGVSRTMGPDEMERELRPIFERLRDIPASLVHYKMCSTFDSSPEVGSIGRAIEIGAAVFGDQPCVPLLVGAPALKRYTVFGHHFAEAGKKTYRLDRHPTMSRHPVTPMDESDLRILLARQTSRTASTLSIMELDRDAESLRELYEERMAERPGVLLFDVLDDVRLRRACGLIWSEAELGGQRFVVGSSGIEYGLASYWQQVGLAEASPASPSGCGAVDRLLVVSGSCSPMTEAQIRYALDRGFEGIRVDTERLVADTSDAEAACRELSERAGEVLRRGGSPLLYTAAGPDDESIRRLKRTLLELGQRSAEAGRRLGERLGRIARTLIEEHGLRRMAVAGGDTSGFVTRELGIYAIEALQPIAPGGPLCRGYSEEAGIDGFELALKGGQVGKEDFFVRVREGK